MTHRAGGELSQIKALKKITTFFFFLLYFFLPNTNPGLVLLVLAHPLHRSFCLSACDTLKSTLGHIPYSPAGRAVPMLALTGSPCSLQVPHQGHTGSDPVQAAGWHLASLTQVTQLLAPEHMGPPVLAQLLTLGPPTHLHTIWGVPHPGEELEMGFNEKTGQTVVTEHWASPDMRTDQPPAKMKPDSYSFIHPFPQANYSQMPLIPPFLNFVSSPKNPITVRCNPQMLFICKAPYFHSP